MHPNGIVEHLGFCGIQDLPHVQNMVCKIHPIWWYPPSPVGNKNDDPANKQVETADALRFGESVGVRVFETSAKENINVEEVSATGWNDLAWHFKLLAYWLSMW